MISSTTLLSVSSFSIIVLLYWIYKKFRSPAYIPGMVRKRKKDAKQIFDDPTIYKKPDGFKTSTKSTWLMPNHIEIYYFPPTIKTKPLTNETMITPCIGIHGGPGIPPKTSWQLFSTVPDFYLYHTRGCGQSTHPFHTFPTPGKMWPGMSILESTLGIAEQIADIERIRRRLQYEYYGDDNSSNIPIFKINLVGHSFGGFIATLYASEFPEYVNSLVLLVPAAVLKIPDNTHDDLFATIRKRLQAHTNPKYLQEYDTFFKKYMDFLSLSNETDDTLAIRQNEFAIHYDRAQYGESKTKSEEIKSGMTGGMMCYATFLSMGIEHDYIPTCKDLLKDTTFPVSIVHGGNDMQSEITSRQYIQLFPNQNVSFHIINDADHFLFDHPDTVSIVQDTIQKS